MNRSDRRAKKKVPPPPTHGDVNEFWRPDANSLLDRFSDEELSEFGLTREDLKDPMKAVEAVKTEAVADWEYREETIELIVTEAIKGINMYPGDRHNQMARLYGEQFAAMDEMTAEDAENMLMTMMMAIFKLAEARVELHKALDGEHRTGG